MRPVTVIQRRWQPAEPGLYGKPAGWVTMQTSPAQFHCFGLALDEDEHCSYSVAIVEYPDGTVDSVSLNCIQFADKSCADTIGPTRIL